MVTVVATKAVAEKFVVKHKERNFLVILKSNLL